MLLLAQEQSEVQAAVAPVVGVITAPSYTTYGEDYLPASYVTWLKSSGIEVIPIPSGVCFTDNGTVPATVWSTKQIASVFKGINGIVLPGGDPWPQVSSPAVRMIIDFAIESNRFKAL